jgi:hypothetical protein
MQHDDSASPEQIFDFFADEEIALAQARAQVAWHERRLTELATKYPDIAVLRQPLHEITVAELRSDELNAALSRINSALKLTGEEPEYWMRLWDHALANFGVSLTAPAMPRSEELPTTPELAPAAIPAAQLRQRWSRSLKPGTSELYDLVRAMKEEGISQRGMCERLDAQKSKMPDLVGWRDLTWRAAYMSPKYTGAVKKWLSKVTSVTP